MKLFLLRRLERKFVHLLAQLVTAFYGWSNTPHHQRPWLARSSAHLSLLLIATLAISLGHAKWPAGETATRSFLALSAPNRQALNPGNQILPINAAGGEHPAPLYTDDPLIVRQVRPNTIIPKRPRLEIITYTVQAGDTVLTIAALFGLQPTTIMWANPEVEDAPDLLRIGQELIILPIDGVYHTVAEGETVETIAEKYKADPEAIKSCPYNGLQPPLYRLTAGMRLIVPGGEKPYIPKKVTVYEGPIPEGAYGTGRFQRPVFGTITQGHWYGHRAIDIGAPTGSAVFAADSGFVSFAGWTDVGYGYLVVIDHGNGFTTYYAHLSAIYVYEGQPVERGQVIGAVGSTGWSTGPHLHFEVRYSGVQQNPLAYLP